MNRVMRPIFIASALVAFVPIVLTSAAAQERQYPWCARYGWTTYNCGFVSYAQCRATTSGVGGYCEPNPRFVEGEQRRKKQNRY
jgi:hypothetical protein